MKRLEKFGKKSFRILVWSMMIQWIFCELGTAQENKQPQLIGNRFITICSFIRVNQIEVSRDKLIGFDESVAHTPAAARLFRETIDKSLPGARITWAFSWLAAA